MIPILKKYYSTNSWIIFSSIIIVYFIALKIEFTYVFTDNFYFSSFIDTVSSIDNYIHAERNVEWINYLLVFVIILIPTVGISIALNIGAVFKEHKVKFIQIFKIVLKSQIIFSLNYLFSVLLRIIGALDVNMKTINNNYSYQSSLCLFDGVNISSWLQYPLQIINITEIIYVFMLAYGYKNLCNIKYSKALFFTIACYGGLIFIWVVFSIFLQTILY